MSNLDSTHSRGIIKTKKPFLIIGFSLCALFIVVLILYFFTKNSVNVFGLNGNDNTNEIHVEIPTRIRVGDQEKIILKVALANDFLLSSFSPSLNLEEGETPYFITLESRLELNGFSFNPPAIVSVNVKPGSEINFTWEMDADQKGEYSGILWLWIVLHPKNADNPTMKNLILARPFIITATSILGLPLWVIRLIAIIMFFIAMRFFFLVKKRA